MFLAGRGLDDVDEAGRPLVDDNLLLLLNASDTELSFTLPRLRSGARPWQLLVDTSNPKADERLENEAATTLVARSLKFFSRPLARGASAAAPSTG